MSLLHDLGANEEREDEGEGEACFRRLLDVMCKVTLACANEYVRLFKEAHRLLLHTQFMTYTFGVPLRKGFYQDLLGKEPFGDVTYGKRLLSRFLLDQWSHDVLGKGEEVALSLVQNLQSTLGLIGEWGYEGGRREVVCLSLPSADFILPFQRGMRRQKSH